MWDDYTYQTSEGVTFTTMFNDEGPFTFSVKEVWHSDGSISFVGPNGSLWVAEPSHFDWKTWNEAVQKGL